MIVTPKPNEIYDALRALERRSLSKGARSPVRGKPNLTDLFNLRVLEIKEMGHVTVLTLALTESDRIIVNVGSDDAMKARDRKYEGPIARPIIEYDDGHALVLRVNVAHTGLIVGSIIDVRVRFSVDMNFQVPVVEAASANLTVRRLARPDAPITLPVTSFREISDEDLGMPRNDGDQLRAEAYLECVIADRIRKANLARAAFLIAAARLMPGPTVYAEVPDDSITLENPTDQLDETDQAIFRQLKRLEAMPLPTWMRGAN